VAIDSLECITMRTTMRHSSAELLSTQMHCCWSSTFKALPPFASASLNLHARLASSTHMPRLSAIVHYPGLHGLSSAQPPKQSSSTHSLRIASYLRLPRQSPDHQMLKTTVIHSCRRRNARSIRHPQRYPATQSVMRWHLSACMEVI